jgi:hypothetical protein
MIGSSGNPHKKPGTNAKHVPSFEMSGRLNALEAPMVCKLPGKGRKLETALGRAHGSENRDFIENDGGIFHERTIGQRAIAVDVANHGAATSKQATQGDVLSHRQRVIDADPLDKGAQAGVHVCGRNMSESDQHRGLPSREARPIRVKQVRDLETKLRKIETEAIEQRIMADPFDDAPGPISDWRDAAPYR